MRLVGLRVLHRRWGLNTGIRPLESSLLMSKSTPPTLRPSSRDVAAAAPTRNSATVKGTPLIQNARAPTGHPKSASMLKIATKVKQIIAAFCAQRDGRARRATTVSTRPSRRSKFANVVGSSPTATRAHISIQKMAQSIGVTTREGVARSTVIVPARSNGLSNAEPSFLAQSMGAK